VAELVKAEHKRFMERALKSASVAPVLRSATGIDSAQRNALQERVRSVISLLDAQRFDDAERELLMIEECMDELRMQVFDRRVGEMLGSFQSTR
jgi:hypothetical protein